MDLTPHHKYDSIQPGQIRLLRFVEDSNTLSAALETFSLYDARCQYKALSYTWDENQRGLDRSWAIRIGKHFLPILDSLLSFVRALRSKGILIDGTWWWIDSICIDQKNFRERDEQVRQMKDTYQKAEEVIVWLGEQSSDSDRALDFVRSLEDMHQSTQSLENTINNLLKQQHQIQWKALRHFFLRKWWTRIWTIQEFVIPSSVSFWCGVRYTSQYAILCALQMADLCNSSEFKGTAAFFHGWNRQRLRLIYGPLHTSKDDLDLSLLSLASYFCSNEATDDRDRLYGLTGLCTENHGLDINYSWSVDEVYLRFAQSFIVRHKSLDIILFASLLTAIPDSLLPSWVPDWRNSVRPNVVPLMVSQSSNKSVGNLRPFPDISNGEKYASYSASGSREALYEFDGLALLAHGCIIDAIDGLAASRGFEFVQSSGQHSQTFGPQCSPTADLTSVCRSLVLDRQDRYLRYSMPTTQFYHDFINLCLFLVSGSQFLVHEKFQDWFQMTRLLLIHGRSLESIVRDFEHCALGLSAHPIPDQDEHFDDTFYGRFFDTIETMSMRLMTTSNGRVGMAPNRAMKGDLICVLFGCSIPVVLRKCEYKDGFILVGECFLDQCMKGEALEQSHRAQQRFPIV